ncbi:hypothetical protein [Arthrobacter sp. SD76]|uniref:hypothetical protein n=1 Tax=Arthrobacter sp. SD76 TaxID=3415007 RepID=UPI003C71BCE9
MNNKPDTPAPATVEAQDSLSILREVSHVYERLRVIRRQAAHLAKQDHTYQALADAMGTTRSAAHQLINRDAA